MTARAEELNLPQENLLAPDTVRRLCWDWVAVEDTAAAVEAFLAASTARPWQRELTVPVLTEALTAAEPTDPR